MSSFFNALQSTSTPHLMTTFGTEAAVTIVSGTATIASNVDAVLRPVKGITEFTDIGEIKKLTREIWVLVDATLSYGGLADDYTGAVVTIDGEQWSVEEIKSKTDLHHVLQLVRSVPRGKHRSGLYVER